MLEKIPTKVVDLPTYVLTNCFVILSTQFCEDYHPLILQHLNKGRPQRLLLGTSLLSPQRKNRLIVG